jgi:hypothetical protein
MKLITTALTAIACISMGFVGGIYAGSIKTPSELALDACARKNNTYSCKWEATPTEPPRVVLVRPDLLPPPVEE